MAQLTIGKLAKACDVNIDTIRYYERMGLLTPLHRTSTGYRVYDKNSVFRLQFIRRVQGLGFTLGEINELLLIQSQNTATCSNIKSIAQDKIVDIEGRIDELKHIKQCLNKLIQDCPGADNRIDQCNILHYFHSGQK